MKSVKLAVPTLIVKSDLMTRQFVGASKTILEIQSRDVVENVKVVVTVHLRKSASNLNAWLLAEKEVCLSFFPLQEPCLRYFYL